MLSYIIIEEVGCNVSYKDELGISNSFNFVMLIFHNEGLLLVVDVGVIA